MNEVVFWGMVALFVIAGIVTAMKGKWGFFILGFVVPLIWVVGALRPMKLNSYWARKELP